MDLDFARSLSYKNMRNMFKEYLQSQELGRNTVGTVTGDSFYLWNNEGKDVFWNTVLSDQFEEEARKQITDALTRHSTGNVTALVNGYVSALRRFRNYVFSVDTKIPEKDDMTALKEFLLDIECLEPLSEWTGKFNLFDILKISRVEIRHSNMLAWLINPSENHGLGDGVVRGIIQFVTTNMDDQDTFDNLLMDCHDFSVLREWHHIDLLAISESNKFLVCIENKIDSGEHNNQLSRYRQQVIDSFPGYKHMFVYLSPEGNESSDPDNWCAMGYQEILNIIDNLCRKIKLLPDAALLVDNYVETIRRDIVGDERLKQICAEIYAKHQKALDLIFDNKPNRASMLAEILRAWAMEKSEQGLIDYVADKSNNTYIRFKTRTMSEILPDAPYSSSGWNTPNYYFYEIRNLNGGTEFYIQLALSSKEIPDDLRAVCDKINEHYPSRQQKENWQWRTPFTTKHAKTDEEMTEEKIFAQMDKRLEEIKAFEEKLKELL